MGEIVQNFRTNDEPKTAVAMGSSRSSMSLLKWAINNLVTPNGTLHLIHVYAPIKYIPTPVGILSVDAVSDELADKFKQQQLNDLRLNMKKYEIFCNSKKVKSIVCLVEKESIRKGLVEHITLIGISKIVIGHTTRSKIASAFAGAARSKYVTKHAPNFCHVLAIHKDQPISGDANYPTSPHLSESSSFISNGSETPGRNGSQWSLQEGGSESGDSEVPEDPHTQILPSLFQVDYPNSDGYSIHMSPGPASSPKPFSCCDLPHLSNPSIDQNNYALGSLLSEDGEQYSQDEIEQGLDVEALQQKLGDARREIQKQSARLASTEEALSTFMKMMKEYDAQRMEEAHLKDAALKKLKLAEQMCAREKKKQEAMAVALETSKKEATMFRTIADDERKKKEELEVALETSKKEAVLLRSIADEEKRMREEAIAALEESEKVKEMIQQKNAALSAELEKEKEAFEMEMRLCKNAEEKALRDAAIAKKTLAKSQQKYTEYSFEELEVATNDFSEEMKLGVGGYGFVYKGTIRYTVAAIKVLTQDGLQGHQEFQREVELLSQIHHPHIVMLLGACPEKACIVYEYMANGSLEDRLARKNGSDPLPWYIRFRVCYEVTLGLMFLHTSQPSPIIHCDMKPANILLDKNFVSKISDVGVARLLPNNITFNITKCRDTVPVGTFFYIDPEYQRTGMFGPFSDVYALGIIFLQILTGKPPIGVTTLVEDALEKNDIASVLDASAGDWPVQEATELALIGLRCAEPRRRDRLDLPTVLSMLKDISEVAETVVTDKAVKTKSSSSLPNMIIPSLYMCPISQEVMKEPHIAADGFTYEYEHIKSWLSNHNTSPMTNLEMEHKNLTPNHFLRSAISDWQSQGGHLINM